MEYDSKQIQVGMIKRLLDCSGQDILEIGCGTGKVAAALAPKAGSYIAIDSDPRCLEQARSLYPGVDFQQGNGEALRFDDASFDGLLFTLSLHHQQCDLALREAYRVLKDDGRLVIVEPAAQGEFQQFFHLFDDETEALDQALRAIAQSDFSRQAQHTFRLEVTFRDQEELCAYPFERTAIGKDDRRRILALLERLRGSLPADRPLLLYETLHIFRLTRKKNPSPSS
jgi:ubiquinone/menaquinone biosynthesis C-methylase UbiE